MAVVAGSLVAVAFLAIVEGILVVLLNHPPPISWMRRVLSAHNEMDRMIIQFIPECARYDAELGYTLRPGTCHFRNRDFATTVSVNTAGVRDNEASLTSPEVIVIGDSFGMGWGVEDQEAFPTLLESACGTTVLNGAISSYATAREARLLSRFPLDALKWLIVQYNDNDLRENREFMERGNRLIPMSEADYRGYQQLMASRQRYQPGENVARFVQLVGGRLSQALGLFDQAPVRNVAPDAPLLDSSEAAVFLNALRHAPRLPDGVRVIVFEVNGYSRNDGEFAAAVREELRRGDVAEPWKSMTVLDLSQHLTEDQYLPLDEHLSVRGHQTLAARLAREMGCQEKPPIDARRPERHAVTDL
jgi:hypothetical protein